jgi:hypothetical protein
MFAGFKSLGMLEAWILNGKNSLKLCVFEEEEQKLQK